MLAGKPAESKNILQLLAPFVGKYVGIKDPFSHLQSLSGWQNLDRSCRFFIRCQDQLVDCSFLLSPVLHLLCLLLKYTQFRAVPLKTLASELRVWDTGMRSHFQLSHGFRKALFLLGYKRLLRILIKTTKNEQTHHRSDDGRESYHSSIF